MFPWDDTDLPWSLPNDLSGEVDGNVDDHLVLGEPVIDNLNSYRQSGNYFDGLPPMAEDITLEPRLVPTGNGANNGRENQIQPLALTAPSPIRSSKRPSTPLLNNRHSTRGYLRTPLTANSSRSHERYPDTLIGESYLGMETEALMKPGSLELFMNSETSTAPRQINHQPLPYATSSRSSSTGEAALDPMERWRGSPPESEAASWSAIAGALKEMNRRSGSRGDFRSRRTASRAASTTSFTSAQSSNSSLASAQSSSSKTSRRRYRNPTKALGRGTGSTKERRAFQCTFCCDTFRTKYDWSRHEKSLHLNLEKWICTPHGGAVISNATGRSHCAYCNMLDPTPAHLKTHNHGVCQDTLEPHVFSRKDHLFQHLRHVHDLDVMPVVDEWKIDPPPIVSRCGFCNARFETWGDRADHLAQHYREGKTMFDWRGDHCFEPSIASQVRNSLPPYLIGTEARSIVPFSATGSGTKDHLSQMQVGHGPWAATPPNVESSTEVSTNSDSKMVRRDGPVASFASYVEVLTSGLARYAQQQMGMGVMPTDRMFQDEARRLLYGTEDAWDQTAADNGEWLSDFRNRHGYKTP
ncbi:homeobox and c2h2 transcription factor protein [Pochonia chlamydosporia 170]|uniref:Homeobox and c2h2 transcription factor protein n=1 Tax=Pochonia chlamydosporia 170 TaxID=1380566 RepID=A0A179FKW9_METCM|nr:homeobox and c2h2 transcription factor protein [Pochonia chlamydosporia 170]OAQ65860.1 homeobox and c2h2 transcription factor protein [Pochonia chlamydosporia 170]